MRNPNIKIWIRNFLKYLKVINKTIGNKQSINYGIEDWKGKPLKPNSSYVYKLYKFNYTNLEKINNKFEQVVHIPTLGIPSDKILFQNNVSNNQKINLNKMSSLIDFIKRRKK